MEDLSARISSAEAVMKKQSAVFRSLIISLLLFASVFYAQGQGGPGGRRGPTSVLLIAIDTDHDGKLSSQEIQAAPRTLLKADRNGDGTITQDELQPPPETAVASPADLSQQLMRFDKNHDGVLTRVELPERLQPLFDRADSNQDGKVTPDELQALAARQTLPVGAQKMQRSRDPVFLALDTNHDNVLSVDEIAVANTTLLTLDKNHDGEISADEMRPPQPSPLDQAAHAISENDINKDGKLSREEAPDWLRGQLDLIDKNHDGFIDRDELAAFFASQGGHRQDSGGGDTRGVGGDQQPAGPRHPDNR